MESILKEVEKVEKQKQEVKELQEQIGKSEAVIKKFILDNIIERKYSIELVDLKYKEEYSLYKFRDIMVKVYYPVLCLPKGFKKDENCYKEIYDGEDESHTIVNDYELTDENGNCIKVHCYGLIRNSTFDSEKGRRLFFERNYFVADSIQYDVTISSCKFHFEKYYGFSLNLFYDLEKEKKDCGN